MNILLLGEFSGLHKELKNALQLHGHEVTVAAANDFWKKINVDINLGYGSNLISYKLRQLVYPFMKFKKLLGYDVVHLINFYIIPHAPVLNLLFLKLLKQNNGIVTLSGAGDDPFFVNFSEETLRYSPVVANEQFLGTKNYMRKNHHLNMMHRFVKNVDAIIPILFEYYSTFCHAGHADITTNPLPIPININNFNPVENKIDKKLFFFHGLNRQGFKGTPIIEKCFNKLTKRYPNEVQCLIAGRMPFNDYMNLIAKINISVDQLYSYSLGMNALYSMAQGKIVVGGAEPESSILYDGQLPPVYNCVPDETQLLATFESIIERKRFLSEDAHLAREFIIKHHDPVKVASMYLDVWSHLV